MVAKSTVAAYETCIRVLESAGYDTVDKLVAFPEKVLENITSRGVSESRVKQYCCAILWKVRLERPDAGLELYTAKITEIQERNKSKEIAQTLTESQEKLYVEWKDVIDVHRKAKEAFGSANPRYILYCLYTLQPPVRADYCGMRMIYDVEELLKSKDINYCYHDEQNTIFNFAEYKTSKSYGTVTFKAPEELHQVLKPYLAGRPKELVPYKSVPSLCTAVKSIFQRLCKKAVNITCLRRAYITDFLSNPQRITQREEIARRMLHSRELQERYQVLT